VEIDYILISYASLQLQHNNKVIYPYLKIIIIVLLLLNMCRMSIAAYQFATTQIS